MNYYKKKCSFTPCKQKETIYNFYSVNLSPNKHSYQTQHTHTQERG